MGVHDYLRAYVNCPVCGKCHQTEIEMSIRELGGYYPGCKTMNMGERVPGFPPLPIFHAQGFVDLTSCCKDASETMYAQVIIERGRIVKVVYPQPPLGEWEPLPRGRRWKRREAARQEEYDRDFKKYLAAQNGVTNPGRLSTLRLAFAMVRPLRINLDYAGFGEIPRKGEHPIYKKEDGKWRRRRGVHYL